MMDYNFAPPPALSSDDRGNLVRMHSFLFQLTQQLNCALSQADQRIVQAESASGIIPGKSTGIPQTLARQYGDLKSLIIKTADTVRSEMTAIETTLQGQYIAKSEWGDYEQRLQAHFAATAEGVVESYAFNDRLESLKNQAADFETFQKSSEGTIRRGIIGYDEDGQPLFGIAIGQDLKTSQVTIDGQTHTAIDMTRSLATYTAGSVTFWQNGEKVAWFSNSELVCRGLNVDEKMTLGGVWEIGKTHGLSIKWIGGDA